MPFHFPYLSLIRLWVVSFYTHISLLIMNMAMKRPCIILLVISYQPYVVCAFQMTYMDREWTARWQLHKKPDELSVITFEAHDGSNKITMVGIVIRYCLDLSGPCLPCMFQLHKLAILFISSWTGMNQLGLSWFSKPMKVDNYQ